MKKYTLLVAIVAFIFSCENPIKNTQTQVIEEEGTQLTDTTHTPTIETTPSTIPLADILGSWVGYFNPKGENKYDQYVYADDGFVWNRANKINISIDEVKDSIIIGHSVVAGNNRPFKGTFTKETMEDQSIKYICKVEEPGDDRYDGVFTFTVHNQLLAGTWKAYKKINIRERAYQLEQKDFEYNPDQQLEAAQAYVNWNKFKEDKEIVEYEEGEPVEEWIYREFATSTNKIYDINASNTLLSKQDVENLKRGDLTIIRNSIYARHGYSFKQRPLRVFFDAQSWYIPIHTDIRSDFTDLEKQNIELLLRYETNAAEYYDSFGRG